MSNRIIRDTRIHVPSTGWKPKSVVVKLSPIEMNSKVTMMGHYGTRDKTPSPNNVPHDQVARAVGMEILFGYPDLCFHEDGTFNTEGFKKAFEIHMAKDNPQTRKAKSRLIEQAKR